MIRSCMANRLQVALKPRGKFFGFELSWQNLGRRSPRTFLNSRFRFPKNAMPLKTLAQLDRIALGPTFLCARGPSGRTVTEAPEPFPALDTLDPNLLE